MDHAYLAGFNHFIVLVHDGQHWIAIERNGAGFRGYDPAQAFLTGGIAINNNAITNNQNNHAYQYSGVIIGIR